MSAATSSGGEPAWLVTRYAEARIVLSDRRFAIALPGVAGGGVGANDSLFQDPPGHTRLRQLVSTAFTPRRVARLRDRTAEIADALIDRMVAVGSPIDLMQAFGLPLPITVIGDLLGVPPADRQRFHAWSSALLSLTSQDASTTDPGTAWANLSRQVGDLINGKRCDPGDDLLSALISVRDTDADRLSEAELVMMAITLITAGYVTTSMGIGLGVILLTGHDQLARLADDAALVPTAVEEVLRFQAATGDVARVATEELELGGVHLHPGDKVVVSLISANRDERRFVDPERFDITRADNPHLTFGHGIHYCLGAALARMELQVVFTALADRLPNLHLAIPAHDLVWQRSELFGDEFCQSVPISW